MMVPYYTQLPPAATPSNSFSASPEVFSPLIKFPAFLQRFPDALERPSGTAVFPAGFPGLSHVVKVKKIIAS